MGSSQAMLAHPALATCPTLEYDDAVAFGEIGDANAYCCYFPNTFVTEMFFILIPFTKPSFVSAMFYADRSDVLPDKNEARYRSRYRAFDYFSFALLNSQNAVDLRHRRLVTGEVREGHTVSSWSTVELVCEAGDVNKVKRLLNVFLIT